MVLVAVELCQEVVVVVVVLQALVVALGLLLGVLLGPIPLRYLHQATAELMVQQQGMLWELQVLAKEHLPQLLELMM